MSGISGTIKVENNNSLSFGNYIQVEKIKINEFKHNGNVYDLRTHKEITRLQKNGCLLIESVPGSAIHNFTINDKTVNFEIEGFGDTQITLDLEQNKDYKILIDGVNVGITNSKVSGKVSFSIELSSNNQKVEINKL